MIWFGAFTTGAWCNVGGYCCNRHCRLNAGSADMALLHVDVELLQCLDGYGLVCFSVD